MTQHIQEAGALATQSSGRLLVTLITPGNGSSGYYAPEVLEAAVAGHVFPKGTQMHVDHADAYDGGVRSVATLAAVLTEDARWDGNALVAEARPIGTNGQLIRDAAEVIGVSISAAATFSEGEVDGHSTTVIESLHPHPLNTVDFVTVPGRGGSFTVLEHRAHLSRAAAAGDNPTNQEVPVAEATNHVQEGNDQAALQTRLTEALVNINTLTAERDAAVKESGDLKAQIAADAEKAKEASVEHAVAVIAEAYGENAPAFIVDAAKHAAEAGTFDEKAAREAATAVRAIEAGQPAGLGPAQEAGAPGAAPKRTSDDLINALHGKEA